ncbi:serine/threonine-protein kinase [Nodularia spumigena]|jgi:uncharacterized protein YjbI with pentapeptide repeats|uniref:Serine/threonine-protein kinase n=2 Tax=Nodularia spumigena TaxID=70799 RepID=A0ABU5URY0_NODSP|nr:serine/threonine-protein kinase [Nodularia spumigena]MEA5525079.1 serine/threonine-protein kinase [Nodularia spumigena UHCC 0143]MEA5607840.1 serine/threonine-protein kinase [Nodularia spumigena UHCC 0060]MEA5611747.1 serine/threonine-protein kinase [Nodularia spumigena UHCC 0040]
MTYYPDFSTNGYQVEKELGCNLTGGRVTYLAKDIKNGQTVVIKQFQFAQPNATWRDYDTIHQEIRVLQKLNNPSIPRYLNSFNTSTGFCLVQEYKKALTLSDMDDLTLEDIHQIAIKCLEILIYLQQQDSVIIHRDIKPENILISKDKKVYLVDFGVAKLDGGLVSSTIAKGTLGFMPPEQLHNRKLTKNSDLYSLGVTLICLLTKTPSTNISSLIDENERINFRKKLRKLPLSFVLWLEKMVERKPEKRFVDADAALKALKIKKLTDNNLNNWRFVIKNFAIGSLSIFVLTLLVYDLNPFMQSDKNTGLEVEKVDLEVEKVDLEVEKVDLEVLIVELQKNQSCVGCDLSGANLSGLFLENVNLEKANLQGADLSSARLTGANLNLAQLENANLTNVNLNNAQLQNSQLEKANLSDAELRGVNLKGANLKNANLVSADLREANLSGANLENANFHTSYSGANLASANLSNANLKNANLQWSNLREANLSGANLSSANLSNARLRGANLSGANKVNAKFNNATF